MRIYLTIRPGKWNTSIAPLQRAKTPPLQRVSAYDTKQYAGEVPVMLELWEMQSTSSLPSLPDLIWS